MNTQETYPSLHHDLLEVVAAIFENMLHLPLTAGQAHPEPPPECIKAVIPFTGSWTGMVVLRCGVEQGRQLASRFLSLPAAELADPLVSDTLGELANMIAGNLKSVFARDIRLSQAVVSRGPAAIEPAFQHAIQEHICFLGAEGPFCVAVLAAQSEPRRAW